MTQPGLPRFLVEAPTPSSWRYGLRSAAQLLTVPLDGPADQLRPFAGGVEYETDQCYQTTAWEGDACNTAPVNIREITVTFTAAPDDDDTMLSAAATVDSGPPRQLSIAVEGGPPVVITTGAAAAPVYTQAPSAAATLDVAVTDVTTGTAEPAHQVTVSLAGAVTGGGQLVLEVGDPILKVFTAANTYVDAGTFTVFAERGCGLTGQVNTEARVRAALEAGEQVTVERLAMARVIAPGATDLTTVPAGHPLKQGLGLLEAYAAAHYGGMATIHAPRFAAPYLADIYYARRDGAVLRTLLDTVVAIGGGYDGQVSPDTPSEAPPAGAYWFYITGQPVIRQTEISVPAPTPARGGANLRRNRLNVLAERHYVVTVDCLRAGVLIDLTREDPA